MPTITIERADLARAVLAAASAVEKRNTVPILGNLRLAAQGAALKISGTNLDQQVDATAPAALSGEGSTTAPAAMLADIVRKLPEDAPVKLEFDDGKPLKISAGRSRFTVQCLPAEDWADLTMTGQAHPHTFALTCAEIAEVFGQVQFAISTEETRYYLNGIYLHAIHGQMVAVATDGHRLARHTRPAPTGSDAMPGVIVPRATVAEALKLAKDVGGKTGEARVDISLSETAVRFDFGDVKLASKLIDGTFPDYQRVIPAAHSKTLGVRCADFAKAIDRVATVSSERGRAIRLAASGEAVKLSVQDPASGEASEDVEADFRGEPVEIGFNAAYLAEIIRGFGDDSAEIRLSEPGAPATFHPEDNPALLVVLMPMRI